MRFPDSLEPRSNYQQIAGCLGINQTSVAKFSRSGQLPWNIHTICNNIFRNLNLSFKALSNIAYCLLNLFKFNSVELLRQLEKDLRIESTRVCFS